MAKCSTMSFFSKVSKCLGDIMSGWKNVSSSKFQCAKMSVHQNVKVSKCLGVASGLSAKWRVSKCRRTRLGRLYQEPKYFCSLNPLERDYFGYWLQGSKHSTTFVVCNLNFSLEKCFFSFPVDSVK